MKRCVVSFADGAGDYRQKMKRLEDSLKGNFDGDFLGFTSYEEIGCEPHQVIPYKFKPYAIKKAIDLGYDQILWCDSPVVAIKNIQPVFDHIEKHGYAFFDNPGHSLGKWTNQKALDYFGMTREEAMNVKMIMASCMGFHISQSIFDEAELFFKSYKALADSLYPGSWADHRHDQTVASFLIEKMGLNIQNGYESFFIYQHFKDHFQIADSVCLVSR